jgi:hypothetical protein
MHLVNFYDNNETASIGLPLFVASAFVPSKAVLQVGQRTARRMWLMYSYFSDLIGVRDQRTRFMKQSTSGCLVKLL